MDSSVNTVTKLLVRRLRNRGSILVRSKRIFFSKACGPHGLLSNASREKFYQRQNVQSLKLATQLNPLPRLRMYTAVPPLSLTPS